MADTLFSIRLHISTMKKYIFCGYSHGNPTEGKMEEKEQCAKESNATSAVGTRPAGRASAKNIAYFAVLIALEIVLQMWGSSISIGGGATLNFSLIPIVLGAILLGPAAGTLLGLVSGIIILVAVIQGLNGAVILYMFNEQPALISIVCLVKTSAAGAVSGIIYKILSKKHKRAAVFVSAVSAPVVNTGLFLAACLILLGTIESAIVLYEVDATSAYGLIFSVFIGFNFFIEFAINVLVSPGLYTVVKVVEKQFIKKKA